MSRAAVRSLGGIKYMYSEGVRGAEKYMMQSWPKFPIYDENDKPINSRSSTSPQSKKYDENYTKARHN